MDDKRREEIEAQVVALPDFKRGLILWRPHYSEASQDFSVCYAFSGIIQEARFPTAEESQFFYDCLSAKGRLSALDWRGLSGIQ